MDEMFSHFCVKLTILSLSWGARCLATRHCLALCYLGGSGVSFQCKADGTFGARNHNKLAVEHSCQHTRLVRSLS